MLGAQMPMDVDGAHLVLPVGSRDGDVIDLHATLVALGDVAAGLRLDVGDGTNDAVVVLELGLLSGAGILPFRRLAGGVEHIASVDDDGGVLHGGGSGRTSATGGVGSDDGKRSNRSNGDGTAESYGGHEDLVVREESLGGGSGLGGIVRGAHGWNSWLVAKRKVWKMNVLPENNLKQTFHGK